MKCGGLFALLRVTVDRNVFMAMGIGADKFIKKPFTISQIGLAVKEEMYN